MEKELKKALDGVCHERDKILQEQLVKEEQRLCVVCQVGKPASHAKIALRFEVRRRHREFSMMMALSRDSSEGSIRYSQTWGA